MDDDRVSAYQPRAKSNGSSSNSLDGGRRLDTKDIFRQLIEDEIRHGRLTRSRRKRIVRYAAQLRLSAVEAGRLIEQCRDCILPSDDPGEKCHALRVVEPLPTGVPTGLKIWVVVVLAILLNLLIATWIW